ncbi:hypothetical protein SAV14893_098670 [Streptomyces avermitilis]|uniref:Uncharacterized protein n=1 Tax=Streptomyces avermitilis TaxID=33903 RepID=A0A4D4MFA9_STRAX|nr:hypothetical protein SAVMC3_90770 [Streptomyces avermitilis]GDY70474.1 hypothetical protein SAV14893_098670 [Streptomyces avermitilis]GDY80789.1 hypothetical protein SAV31267_102740 [Streptomyces avermitilis]
MRRQQIGGGCAGGRIRVVPAVRGQDVGEPRVDVLLHVQAGPPGEFVPGGFVALAGLGLLQRAELAQRLELTGAGPTRAASRSSASRAAAAAALAASSSWTRGSASGS